MFRHGKKGKIEKKKDGVADPLLSHIASVVTFSTAIFPPIYDIIHILPLVNFCSKDQNGTTVREIARKR